jgi:hypothetical protein
VRLNSKKLGLTKKACATLLGWFATFFWKTTTAWLKDKKRTRRGSLGGGGGGRDREITWRKREDVKEKRRCWPVDPVWWIDLMGFWVRIYMHGTSLSPIFPLNVYRLIKTRTLVWKSAKNKCFPLNEQESLSILAVNPVSPLNSLCAHLFPA